MLDRASMPDIAEDAAPSVRRASRPGRLSRSPDRVPRRRVGFCASSREISMALLSPLPLPMSILGSLLFVLGLVLIRLAKQVGQRPRLPRWMSWDMASFVVGPIVVITPSVRVA
ncbi:MAG: hypothetical protein R3F54_13875 [Alphaproteobacteria bacterium]